MYKDPLHVLYIRANQWMHAVELQINRVISDVLDPKVVGIEKYRLDWNQRMRDIDYYLIALNRFKRGIYSVNKIIMDESILNALSEFDKEIVDLKDLRDIAEHFDDYDWNKGKLESKLTSESPSYYWGPKDAGITYRGKNLSMINSLSAARKLHAVILDYLSLQGMKVNLSEWPLIKYKNN